MKPSKLKIMLLVQFIYANAAYGSGDANNDLDEIQRSIEDMFGVDECRAWRDPRGSYWAIRHLNLEPKDNQR